MEDVESKATLEPSDSEIIRGILANGPIPWVSYEHKKLSGDNNSTTPISAGDSAPGVTDKTEEEATDSGTSVHVVDIIVPTVVITPCQSLEAIADVPLQAAPPASPFVGQHNPGLEYLQLPVHACTAPTKEEPIGPVISNATGEEFALAAPPVRKKKKGKVAQDCPAALVGPTQCVNVAPPDNALGLVFGDK